MKVICISNEPDTVSIYCDGVRWPVTLGKIYEDISYNASISRFTNMIRIINDRGNKVLYPKRLFKPISEVREEKINSLLEK
jgi:hypothetical protein